MKLEEAKIGMRVGLCKAQWIKFGGSTDSFCYYFNRVSSGKIIGISHLGIDVQSLQEEQIKHYFDLPYLVIDE